MHRRHILPKEPERRWPRSRDQMQRNYYPQRPIMAYPPYHSNHTLSTAPIYPVWGQPGNQQAGAQVWGQPGYPAWQPTNNWHWNSYPGVIHVFDMTICCLIFSTVNIHSCKTPWILVLTRWLYYCMFDNVGYFDVSDACWSCLGLPCCATYTSSLYFLPSSECADEELLILFMHYSNVSYIQLWLWRYMLLYDLINCQKPNSSVA